MDKVLQTGINGSARG